MLVLLMLFVTMDCICSHEQICAPIGEHDLGKLSQALNDQSSAEA